MLAGLGLEGYRLSIARPRVMYLDGTPNRQGLDFYKRLLSVERRRSRRSLRFIIRFAQHLEDRGGVAESRNRAVSPDPRI